jgi:phage anti-repressor protein
MMNQIIEIRNGSIGGSLMQTADARDLHAFLEVKSEFRHWIKNRIEDFSFVEGNDFTTVGKNLPSGGRQIEYHLTLDMAKELSMVERTEKGKQARQYFIACERQVQSGAVSPPPQSPKLVGELAIMECYTRMLRPAPSSQIAMLAGIAKQNGLDAAFLPAYAIDAPPSADGSSMPTMPLTALLVEHGVRCTAASFNLLLREAGLLEKRERKTSTGATKAFWAITTRGLEFGKNITSPASPRETQPHWYAERFGEVLSQVNARVKGKAA